GSHLRTDRDDQSSAGVIAGKRRRGVRAPEVAFARPVVLVERVTRRPGRVDVEGEGVGRVFADVMLHGAHREDGARLDEYGLLRDRRRDDLRRSSGIRFSGPVVDPGRTGWELDG